MIVRPPDTNPAASQCSGTIPVLIRFRHGLGDAVQLTSVLRHLQRHRPAWSVDVAALVGKHSAMRGLCRKVFLADRESPSTESYQHIYELEWPECVGCYSDSPSTQAERCLREVFSLTPEANLWRYSVRASAEDHELARHYLERGVRVAAGENGRYPIVLIHYEGNTSPAKKNLSVAVASRLCQEVLNAGHVPVILDWDRRSPLPDGERIFNPHTELELWRGSGTGDAGVIAALIERATLVVGVDSGPLHVAAALTTPTIAVWTGHHPVHYLCPADCVVHLVPAGYERLLRGDREAGQAFFERHYRYQMYGELASDLARVAREQLSVSDGSLVFTRSFWIRANNANQDLVVVNDIVENDAYHVEELPMPAPVVIDVGAHIGCFAARLHRRNPLARIIAVECCPENIPALKRNVGSFATILQAAVTYETNVALLNAVFPNCQTTGGSIVASRPEIERRLAIEVVPGTADTDAKDYWADLRPLPTLTLEQIVEQHGIDEIELLKLDCEGSEFSILQHTTQLSKIKMIIGEYHGRTEFHKLVQERFAGWELRILKDGDLGTFWLRRPAPTTTIDLTDSARSAFSSRRRVSEPLLVAAMLSEPPGQYDLLTIEDGEVVSKIASPGGQLRGFAEFEGQVWTIDSWGAVYRIEAVNGNPVLREIGRSRSAWEAHDLSVVQGRLVTAVPPANCLTMYEPASNTWTSLRPWLITAASMESTSAENTDRYHVNSVIHDGRRFVLSLLSAEPKPPQARWREQDLTQGLIVRWGPEGFDERPIAESVYAPHSLRMHQGALWWCDSFRGTACNNDGWVSPNLGGLTRGLRVEAGVAIVGLSRSRLPGFPEWKTCGLALVDVASRNILKVVKLPESYVEVYDLLPWPRRA